MKIYDKSFRLGRRVVVLFAWGGYGIEVLPSLRLKVKYFPVRRGLDVCIGWLFGLVCIEVIGY